MLGVSETDQVVALCAEDYPRHFVSGQHPKDCVVTKVLDTKPEFIFHHVRGKNNRLWFRAAWKLPSDEFTTMSFLLDTGAPKHLYLSEKCLQVLEKAGVVQVNEDFNIMFVVIFGRKCPVERTPSPHSQANIMGLKLLMLLGLQLSEEEPYFSFTKKFDFITAEALA
ncbi:hypothetical protein HYH03_018563 [Edaphochlamys debaryana]|uniref:Uncharacterized protein n=1 Tax=Edaphochlamys debaryana TaxID=47281 RepID=A0A836BPE5_9CHLO|nr:hypothetical protein HYH03_018563 [Edaphochlamys debaryana]|eukprot:KAG2482518.1 hypothetical protein HYH03_018563 [Edaphochlamys debaryana]